MGGSGGDRRSLNVDHKNNSLFIETARALECDESEQRFNEALGKIARHKPKPEIVPSEKTGYDAGIRKVDKPT